MYKKNGKNCFTTFIIKEKNKIEWMGLNRMDEMGRTGIGWDKTGILKDLRDCMIINHWCFSGKILRIGSSLMV